jgi:hypothetical protein
MEVVRTIFKRLFRVYAHIYHSHFKQVCSLGEEAHLNTCFKHFIFFVRVSGCWRSSSGWHSSTLVAVHGYNKPWVCQLQLK